MSLPLWVPDGEEGWMLVFPNGETLHFDNRCQEEDGDRLLRSLPLRVP